MIKYKLVQARRNTELGLNRINSRSDKNQKQLCYKVLKPTNTAIPLNMW